MKDEYLAVAHSIERLHRRFIDAMKTELKLAAIADIKPVQAMMVYHIADGEMTVGELTLTGCYLGTNPSYNLQKLMKHGYITQSMRSVDRRCTYVKLTPKGQTMRHRIARMLQRHAELMQDDLPPEDLRQAALTLRRLERLWDAAARPAVIATDIQTQWQDADYDEETTHVAGV